MAPRNPEHGRWGGFASMLMLAVLALVFSSVSAFAAPSKVAGGIQFTYTDANAKSVCWAGAFNGWNATANPMTKGANGVWSVVLPLPAGEQQYKFVVDTQWFADPENSATAGEYGNSVVKVGADGNLVAQAATSNTAYSPKLFLNGRVIGLYQSTFDPALSRYELRRPQMDIDLGFDIRVSDVLRAHWLMNIDPQKEDVQDYRSRLNFKRGALEFEKPDLRLTAYDSETIGTWDDPMHLVGAIGVFERPYGSQRQGFVLKTPKLGFDTEVQYSDNFSVGGTEYPSFKIDRGTGRQFTFEDGDDATIDKSALTLLQTRRNGAGYELVQNQLAKLVAVDAGNNGGAYGYGDGDADVFAMRVRRALPGGLTMGLLGRNDRGFNLGRIRIARPIADSTVRLLSGIFAQEKFSAGVEGVWSPRAEYRIFGEFLEGARRYSVVSGSWSLRHATEILGAGIKDSTISSLAADGEHLTVDRSWRAKIGGGWTMAQGDVGLTGAVEYQHHSYPLWTQVPTIPPGNGLGDHPRFENVEFQRASYTNPDIDIDNSMFVWDLAWDRNWRHYLDREVKSRVEFQLTSFDYDPRTSWQYQLWFPTGNFWLENQGQLVSIDRLTALGSKSVMRLRPSVAVPFWYARRARFDWRGTFSWADSEGVSLSRGPRYAESIFRVGFDLNPALRLTNDTRWVKYDAPELGLGRSYFSQFTELKYLFSPSISLAFGVGVDPNVLDPVTNEFAPIGRDVYLNNQNASGYIAETSYSSLAPQISAAEKRLQDEKRIQLQAVVHF